MGHEDDIQRPRFRRMKRSVREARESREDSSSSCRQQRDPQSPYPPSEPSRRNREGGGRGLAQIGPSGCWRGKGRGSRTEQLSAERSGPLLLRLPLRLMENRAPTRGYLRPASVRMLLEYGESRERPEGDRRDG